MNSILTLYHGSNHIIVQPEYGFGRIHNDYDLGFYCTNNLELAKEWSASGPDMDGFVNVYKFDSEGLDILNLDKESVLTWISILLNNRTFEVKGPLAEAAIEYLNENFLIDYSGYDVINGWRADDSYFAFANDFINGTISVQSLGKAMRFGNLGMQYVLKSRKAFERIMFQEAIKTPSEIYYSKRISRDNEARNSYLNGERARFNKGEIFITDIIRQEIGKDDPRIQ